MLEYIALSEAVTEIIYLFGVCKQLAPSKSTEPIRIYEDNLGVVRIANFPLPITILIWCTYCE